MDSSTKSEEIKSEEQSLRSSDVAGKNVVNNNTKDSKENDDQESSKYKIGGASVSTNEISVASSDGNPGYFADLAGAHELLSWVRSRIRVAGYDAATMWNDGVHNQIVIDFIYDPGVTRLIAYVTKTLDRLILSTDKVGEIPKPTDAYEFQYFVRGPSVTLTPATIQDEVVFGVCSPQGMETLLRVMSNLYVPQVSGDQSLPAGVRRSLTDHLHKFMASLTETVHQAHGKTVLYLPQENVDLEDLEKVRADKDLVQRLESTVIRWTRQIKEAVNLQDNSMNSDAETATPLDEISFWESRTLDLSGIRKQLETSAVSRIANVLRAVKSNYLAPFEELAHIIHVGSQEAEDNLKFLSALSPCCQEIEEATPLEVIAVLPKLMMVVRMVWNVSNHYNRAERLTGLLRKVSNQIMARCCASIPLEGVFGKGSAIQQHKASVLLMEDEDQPLVDESLNALRQSVKCGEAWRSAYRNAALLQNRSSKLPWNFKESSIFAQIDAFVQRCKDLEEVCDGKIQFSRERGANSLPVFGGMQGPSISRAIIGLGQQFERYMSSLRSVTYNVLDVKETQWHTDFNGYKNGVKDLEVMMSNVMTGAFEGLETVDACVDMLRCFESLTKKEAVRKALEKKTEGTLILFQSQIKDSRARFDRNRVSPSLMGDEPTFAGAASWARGMKSRVAHNWSLLQNARRWLPKVRHWGEVEASCEAYIRVLDEYIERKYKDWLISMENYEDGENEDQKGKDGSLSLTVGLEGHLVS